MSEDSHSSGFFLDETVSPWTSQFKDSSLIHQGNVFEVWRAQRYGRWFALKCLRPELCGQTAYEQMLQKEYSILLRLHNEYVVSVVSFEKMEDRRFAIVEEWIDGITLAQWKETGRGKAEREAMALQLAEAICYLHDHGIIYRDLKPDNVMVTADGKRLKLIDFNLADEAASTIMKRPAGTPEYADPESKEDIEPSELSDIYSLGRVLQDLGVFRRTSRRCMAPRNKRLPTAKAAQKSLYRERKGRKRMAQGLTAAVVTVCIAAPLWWIGHNTTETEHKELPVKSITKMDTVRVTVYDTITPTPDAMPPTTTTETVEAAIQNNMAERDKEIDRLIDEGKAYEDELYNNVCVIASHFDTLTSTRFLRPDAHKIIENWTGSVRTFVYRRMKPRIELTEKDKTLINITLSNYHNSHRIQLQGSSGTDIITRYNIARDL